MSTKKYEEFSRKKEIILSKDEFCSMRDDKEKWIPVFDYLVGDTADAMPEFRFRRVVPPKPDPAEDKSVLEKKFGTKSPSFSAICKSCGKEFRDHSGWVNAPLCVVKLVSSNSPESDGIKNPNPKKTAKCKLCNDLGKGIQFDKDANCFIETICSCSKPVEGKLAISPFIFPNKRDFQYMNPPNQIFVLFNALINSSENQKAIVEFINSRK
jgi:hypothetical protein